MSNKKTTIFGDQTNSSRIMRLKEQTLEMEKKTFRPFTNIKTTTKINNGYDVSSRDDALLRVRAGGYMVKSSHKKNVLPPMVNKTLSPTIKKSAGVNVVISNSHQCC